jgi:cyanophycin synthetase
MRIVDLKVMRGPNYWSICRQKLIVMKLDLEELEERPTSKIPGFSDRIEKLMPGLYKHRCSEGEPGGFFYRVRKGTWMGHVIEHMALELQTMAGMECGYGRTRSAGDKGVYNVVFSYMEENAGIYAARAAVRIAEALVAGENYDLAEDLKVLTKIREREALGPSTAAIVEEAESRGIPYLRLNKHSLVMLGYGINQRRIQSTICCTTGNIAVDIACDKEETKALLDAASIPVPRGEIIYDEEELDRAVEELGYPLVIKPVDGNHGRGITVDITSREKALEALALAQRISDAVIVERCIHGSDFRFLVINYKLVAVARRTPAFVTGDGKSTVAQLVERVNSDERRGNGHSNVLSKIVTDEVTHTILKEKNLSLDSILPENEVLFLKHTANISTGGTATDVTDLVHPANAILAERIARIIGLDICGIDIMAPCVSTPIRENGGAVLEVNAAPGFRMHLNPTHGLPRNVAAPVIDMLFPEEQPFTIPIVAITGTNGKTTTARLVAHLMGEVGHKVGYSTSNGVYIQDQMVERGDCTGPLSAQFVLKDPTIDFAVLECARGGIVRAGLGFGKCDIGIVTNVADDHLGLDDIHTLEEMAKVKSVVPESVSYEGYAILNADDDLVYGMHRDVDCQIALFSLSEDNSRIKSHCSEGGVAAIVENGYITICKGSWKTRVEEVVKVPLTCGGKAEFMIQNILPAVLTAYLRNVKIDCIRRGLRSFVPSPEKTPGRMNLFRFRNFELLLDYAHNTHAFKALGKYLSQVPKFRVGVISAPGDRRDEDLINMGRLAATMFDEIIIRQDKDLRGRTEEEIFGLLKQGIDDIQAIPVKAISGETDAIRYVIAHARKDSFVVVCGDMVSEALELITGLMEKDRADAEGGEAAIAWHHMEKMSFIKY